MSAVPYNVRLSDGADSLIILDQRRLPLEEAYLELHTREELFDAIRSLAVRGAPAIGIAAGYGYYLCAREDADKPDFFSRMDDAERYLASARPTAVNLFRALARMRACLKRNALSDRGELIEKLRLEAEAIQREDVGANVKISEAGLTLMQPGMGVLTHCNAGPLATSLYGTALGPILLAQERGYAPKVFADETRPLMQGARLTAYELNRAGVDVTLICDNMAGQVMREGRVQAVFIGCDRAAMNGDCANKIGSASLAVLAKHYSVPFYIFMPLTTADPDTPSGDGIRIEERAPEEVTELFFRSRIAPDGIKVYNPAFDVVDHSLITAIVTEEGVLRPPFDVSLRDALERSRSRAGDRSRKE